MATKRLCPFKGQQVRRKKDNELAIVLSVSLAVPSMAHPGPFGKTVVTLRLCNETLALAVGGDQTGDLSWFRQYWKEA
jgi:hypothetical protein